jgi:hypothetical protein
LHDTGQGGVVCDVSGALNYVAESFLPSRRDTLMAVAQDALCPTAD